MVIAVPAPFVVQGNDEQIGMFEIFQRFLPGSRPRSVEQNGLTQRTTQAVKDGGTQQESLDVCRLLLQNFFNQGVPPKLIAAGGGLNKKDRIFFSLPLKHA